MNTLSVLCRDHSLSKSLKCSNSATKSWVSAISECSAKGFIRLGKVLKRVHEGLCKDLGFEKIFGFRALARVLQIELPTGRNELGARITNVEYGLLEPSTGSTRGAPIGSRKPGLHNGILKEPTGGEFRVYRASVRLL